MAYISKINQEKNEWSKIDSDLIAVGLFEEKTLTLFFSIIFFALKYGSPIFIPSFFASFDLAIMHPSLFDRTTIGLPISFGLNILSHDA